MHFTHLKAENEFFDPQNGQNVDVKLVKNSNFFGPFSVYELYYCLVGIIFFQKSFPLIAKQIKTKHL